MSSQVPVWIPLAVAFLGVLGVIAGQIINAWREDRRWRREQEREEIRWQRARITENAKLRLEHADQWRETKIKTYANLLRLLAEMRDLMVEVDRYVARNPSKEKYPPARGDVRRVYRETQEACGEIRIIGSANMVEAVDYIGPAYYQWCEAVDSDAGSPAKTLRRVGGVIENVRDTSRHELAVDGPEIVDDASVGT
jgi:hypothetical protein